MIGVLIPGSPIITGQLSTTNFVFDVKNPKNIDNIGIFLTKSIQDDYVAAIFYTIPPNQTQQYIGYICNKRPSDIFYAGWNSDPEANVYQSIKICVKMEKLEKIKKTFALNNILAEGTYSFNIKPLQISSEIPSELNLQNKEYDSSSLFNQSSFQASPLIEINSLQTENPIIEETTALHSDVTQGLDIPELQTEIITDSGKDNAVTFDETQITKNNENLESEYIPQMDSILKTNLEQGINILPSNEESLIPITTTQEVSSKTILQETSELNTEPVNFTENLDNGHTQYILPNLPNEAFLSDNLSTHNILQPSQTIHSSDLGSIPTVPFSQTTTFNTSNTITNEITSSLPNTTQDNFKDDEEDVATITPLKGSFAVSRKNKIVGRSKYAHVTPVAQ